MKKAFLPAALILGLLLSSCESPLAEQPGGFDPEYEAALKEQTIFSEPGLVVGTELVEAGATVTTISFPEEAGPWTAALVKGEGDTHNRLFKIEPSDDPAEARLLIKGDDGPLAWGHYSARIRVGNEAGLAFRRILEFDVTLTPPFFSKAPGIYPVAVKSDGSTYPTLDMQYSTGDIPDITKGKHKLVIKWDKRATATSYKVYVGTMSTTIDVTKDPTKAPNMPPDTERILLGTYDDDTTSTELTGYPTGTDGLPDNARYWVWVSASNASGETPLSPVGTKKTSVPVQSYFYENKNDKGEKQTVANYHDCGGNGDYYRFTPTTAKYWFGAGFGAGGGYNYLGDIVYHETIDLGPDGENGAFPDKIKDHANCLGLPAGVFVIKYREGHVPSTLTYNDKTPGKKKRYGAVYYWGTGAIKPEGLGTKSGRVESDIVNQWGGGKKYGGYAETVTYEEAIDKFTPENIVYFLGLDPEPYYKEFNTELTGPYYLHDSGHETWPGEGVYTADLD
ncbi:MAG: hypothetical protein LBD86_05270 [Spirochaetaceae bacterium]|jgi:hypothetical protein|nr:hypothetical protein [Spirochaetaceae bacterium]